jgi:2-desacetyl-2-hydroxyethyl bacteriochlorophyllide A dehydrogenase
MKAIELTAPGLVQLVDRPEPTPREGEVLLRVCRVGFCGTDLSSYRGVNPLVSYPRVPGHEISATIERLGPGVDGQWQSGQNVLVIPYNHCGQCSACIAGRPNCCAHNETLGVQREGAMAELIAVPASKLIASDRLSPKELAMVEPLTIGFHAAKRGQVTAADTVVVLGSGTIGLGVIAGCVFHGAKVIAVDIDDAKLALAKRCGVSATVNSRKADLHDELQRLTGGLGPAVIIEAVGGAETFRLAVAEASHAGRIVYLGYSKTPVEYDTTQFVLKELDIRGSRNALAEDFADVLRMLEGGGFPVDAVVTHSVSMADAADAFRQWSDSPASVTKIQVVILAG